MSRNPERGNGPGRPSHRNVQRQVPHCEREVDADRHNPKREADVPTTYRVAHRFTVIFSTNRSLRSEGQSSNSSASSGPDLSSVPPDLIARHALPLSPHPGERSRGFTIGGGPHAIFMKSPQNHRCEMDTVRSMPSSASSRTRLRALGMVDAIQIGRLSAKLVHIELLLRRRPISEVAPRFGVQFLRPSDDQRQAQDPNIRYTADEWRWVKNHRRVVKRWPWDKSCLRRSLLLGWILRHRHPDLMIGARSGEDGQIEAHAWIRLDGVDMDIESRSYLTF